jgi:ABC-type glycerol-3-phosphate transport system substrate-binding protein
MLAGCNQGAAKTSSTGSTAKQPDAMTGELRINAQSWFFGKYDFVKIKADFEAKHPGVTISYQKLASSDTTTNMLQWAVGKTDCDITLGGSREDAVTYVAKDYLMSFGDDFFSNGLKKADFVPAFLQLGDIKGTQYVIPLCNEVFMIDVNKSLMAKAGLTDASGNVIPATTWDELYTYAQKATVKTNGAVTQTGLSIDWGANDGFQTYMASLQGAQGTLYGSDKKTVDFSSAKATSFLTTWKKLIDGGYTPIDTFADQDAGRTNFKAGKVAMLIAPASRSVEAATLLGKANITTMAIPGTDKNGSFTYTQGIMVPKLSTHQTLDKDFIKEELLSNNFLQPAMTGFGKLSPLVASYKGQDQTFSDMLKVAAKAATAPLYLDYNRLSTQFITENQNYLKGGETLKQMQSNMAALEKSINLTTAAK